MVGKAKFELFSFCAYVIIVVIVLPLYVLHKEIFIYDN